MENIILGIGLGIPIGGFIVFLLWHKRILSRDSVSQVDTDDNKTFFRDVAHAVEMERNRIANDIHDDIAASLSSMHIDLQIVSLEASRLSVDSEKRLLDMRHKINGAIESLRRVINGLLPDSLDRGDLNFAVNELCNKKDGSKGTRIKFESTGEPAILNNEQKLYIYRIIQELINNSIKHSLAWHMTVKLHWTVNELIVIVRDDGKGFVIENARQPGKHGMAGIFARSSTIGATAKFNDVIVGMEFQLNLPIKRELANSA